VPTAETGADIRQVYRSEFDRVWRLLIRLGAARSELEDLAHEVFLIALRRWDTYDRSRPVRPWLFGIAYRVASDARRQRGRSSSESDDSEELPAAGTPESAVADAQARLQLQRAMDSLDIEKRAVFVMHDVDDCTAPEVAEALQIPLNTVYSRLRRAREDVAQALRLLRRGET
jgi:RNA polymerase sigma-70 factor (ECF subfamily)